MSYSEEDLQIEIGGLRAETKTAKANIADFSKRHFNGVREEALIYCLSRATDLAEGCLVAVSSKLPTSLGILARGLLETLFWTYWIAQSAENAQTFKGLATNDLKLSMRKNLTTGYGRVVHTGTQEDKTQELLADPLMKTIPKRMKIEDAARLAGLERLYTQFYGILSVEAHGKAFGISSEEDTDDKMFAFLSLASALLPCINLIVKDWIVERKLTAIDEVWRVLGYS